MTDIEEKIIERIKEGCFFLESIPEILRTEIVCLEAVKENEVDIYSNIIDKVLTMEKAVVEKINTQYKVIHSENDMEYINEKLEINGKIYENLVKVKGTFKNPEYGHFYMIYGESMGILQNKTAGDELITVVKIEEN